MPSKFLLLLLFPVLTAVAADAQRVKIIYTADRHGEVEPCGCVVDQFGGIDRMATWMSGQAGGQVLLLDSGDSFFSSQQVNPSRETSENSRAELVADAYREMKVDAFSPGERDFAFGLERLKELLERAKVGGVSANLTNEKGEGIFQPYVILQRDQTKFAVTGLTDPKLVAGVLEIKAKEPMSSLEGVLEQIKKETPDQIILLSHLGLDQDRVIAAKHSGLAIIGSHSLDVLEQPIKVNDSFIFQTMFEGQRLGEIRWEKGKGVTSHRLVNLSPDLDQAKPNQVKKWLIAFREKEAEREKKANAKPSALSASHFVGNPHACKQCHEKQFNFWEGTKHASAYLVLFAKNQHLNAECIGCHSLGFKDGGFSLPRKSIVTAGESERAFIDKFLQKVFTKDPGNGELDSRKDPVRYSMLKKEYHRRINEEFDSGKIKNHFASVQCEHCHGSRVGHPGTTTQKRVKEESCTTCHTPARSPTFEPAWKKRIACPLMGKS